LTTASGALRILQKTRPDSVIHLAATVGGIGANQANPAVFWQQNLLMGINVLDACLGTGVIRLLIVGTTCSYPRAPKTVPFIEEELFDGYPEPTNAPYGIAKRCLITGAMAYRKQFGLDVVAAIPTNLYGPWDNFDPKSSHVIPALIRKVHDAHVRGEKLVEIWGTGKATRDFLYVADAAEALVTLLQKGASGSTVNIGSGREVAIGQVAEAICATVGFKGKAVYKPDMPDGQPRRVLDTSKMKSLGWKASTILPHGLAQTYDWWRANRG
jgi:GDP-L-fucose synthase